jgi:hypothetical protein
VNNLVTVRARVDDSDVCADISEALARSWLFDPTTVSVSSDDGTVHLDGTVRTLQERRDAVRAAWPSPSTTAVENHTCVARTEQPGPWRTAHALQGTVDHEGKPGHEQAPLRARLR